MRNVAALIGGAIAGVAISFLAVIFGSHGGSTIPLILFDAPILLLVLGASGSEYFAIMLIGGGLLYGLYAVALACSAAPRRVALILLAAHGTCVLAATLYVPIRF
jgi:hypothetical protein